MIYSKKILNVIFLCFCCLASFAAGSPEPLKAGKVFAEAPLEVLDMLRPSVRLDMLDYYTQADSIVTVQNALGGESKFQVVTDDYIKVWVSPVSTLEIKVLPFKGGNIAMTIYTVGGDSIAADSKVDFFDADLKPLPFADFLKAPDPSSFFNLKGTDISKDDLKEWMPFQTVGYSTGPGEAPLMMELTILCTLPNETREKLKDIMIPVKKAIWTGSKFKFK